MDLNDASARDWYEALADRQATAQLRAAHQGHLDGDMTLEALPTVYRSTTFRSALEASWAATLDAHGIAWEYEPETVTLPSGARYLPDFHLPELGTWIEVKGTGVPRVEKAFEFGASLACDCPRMACTCRWPGGELVLVGHPSEPYPTDPDWNYWQRRAARRRGRSVVCWTSTRRRGCWFGRCAFCGQAGWFDSRDCRACGRALIGTHGHRSGSTAVEFIRISGPAPSDEDEPAQAAA
jgi:hypothetical protein